MFTLDGTVIIVRKIKMKKVNELRHPKKDQSLEVVNFLKEIHEDALKNIADIEQQLIDAEKELSRRRSLGEKIQNMQMQ